MKKKLESLKEPFVAISGASEEQMRYQLDDMDCYYLSQSGNNCPDWQNTLSTDEKKEIQKHIKKYSKIRFDDSYYIEDRGCQIAFSFIGHETNRKIKAAFDPTGKFRDLVLEEYPFESETLTVRVAGTTCLDYTRKDGTKGKNIERYLKKYDINKKDCVYYGDALREGGNDETVIGVIDTISVTGPDDLYKKLCELE